MPAKLDRSLTLLSRTSLLVVALGGWVSLVWLLSALSEAESAFLLGYSLERIILATVLLIPVALFSFWAVKAWGNSNWLQKRSSQISHFLDGSRFWTFFAAGSALLVSSWVLFFLPLARATQLLGSSALYLERLKPLLLFGILLGSVGLLLVLFLRFGFDLKTLQPEKAKLRLGCAIFLLLLFFAALIALTGLGLGFDASIWNAPGAPVLSSQVFLCLLAAPLVLSAAFGLRRWWQKRTGANKQVRYFRLDLGLTFLVWLLASLLWLSQPAAPTYYSSEPVSPNFESYPLSDAFNHDAIANNVLIGEGFHFGSHVAVRRPVYVLFLAGLEGLLGPNYDSIVVAQVLVLALFPALLYLLGTKLHNRLSGLLLASIVTLREANSIALGDVANMSHAKLLMADLPTALLVAGLALAAVVWLRGSARSWIAPLLVGGLLGWSILLRSQSLTLLPFFILLALLVWGWRAAWRPALLFTLGMLLVASPWIIRNRVLMGQWAIEDAVVSGFLATRYSFTPGTFGLPFLPGETEGEYYARHMQHVRDFTLENPVYVAGFVADNYVRNQTLNFMALPLSLKLRDAETHVRELPYWPGWEGGLASETYLPMIVNLFLVGLGLAVAWKQVGWVGLVPLFINLGFTFNLALARVSGWRYNLPADWTVILYYALGIGQLIVWGLLLLRRSRWAANFLTNLETNQPAKRHTAKNKLPASIWKIVATVSVLLFAGSSFLIIEAFSQPRYSEVTQEQGANILTGAESHSSDVSIQQLTEMLATGQLEVVSGRALYPRHYRAGAGDLGRGFALVDPMDFERVTFYLLGPHPGSVVLRVDNSQISFPASSDVYVFRCDDDTLEAAAVLVTDSRTNPVLYISTDLTNICPAVSG